jgi:ferredoxin--NADP+ reductase
MHFSNNPLKVAVVGAGPAGIYTADALTFDQQRNVRVDILERLPTPFGLLRYGVAPDHFKMKSLEKVLQRVLDRPAIRFFGNVNFGVDIARGDLLELYDAIVYAPGAAGDRRLSIPGEDYAGNLSATEFVAWYNGHPHGTLDPNALDARSVAVIGMGNVAVDVTRMLLKRRDILSVTDIPQDVLGRLCEYRPTDVYLIGRRGVAHAKFTPKELRELGEMEGVDIVVSPDELVLDDVNRRAMDQDPNIGLNVATLHEWAARPLTGSPHRIHLRFLLRPVQILGDGHVRSILLERMALDGNGSVKRTEELLELPVAMILRSVGHRGYPLCGVPFDPMDGIIPNQLGRVVFNGDIAPREFVTGWARRGPRGVLGTNRADALEVAEIILSNIEPSAAPPDRADLSNVLASNGIRPVTLSGWSSINAAEIALGKALGRARVKLNSYVDLLSASDSV